MFSSGSGLNQLWFNSTLLSFRFRIGLTRSDRVNSGNTSQKQSIRVNSGVRANSAERVSQLSQISGFTQSTDGQPSGQNSANSRPE
ncbi:hypothetical protein Hdeb2414_s0024g00653641 [Helianthus debilis subsp. tardiflorus]